MSRRLSRVGDRGEQMDPQKQKFIFRVIVFSDYKQEGNTRENHEGRTRLGATFKMAEE